MDIYNGNNSVTSPPKIIVSSIYLNCPSFIDVQYNIIIYAMNVISSFVFTRGIMTLLRIVPVLHIFSLQLSFNFKKLFHMQKDFSLLFSSRCYIFEFADFLFSWNVPSKLNKFFLFSNIILGASACTASVRLHLCFLILGGLFLFPYMSLIFPCEKLSR